MLSPISSQAEISRAEISGDWAVFISKNPNECWAVSTPNTSENTRDGKLVSVKRGKIQLFSVYRPSEGVSGQISFTGGYPLSFNKKVLVTVGSKIFNLEVRGEWAWPTNKSVDAEIRSAFQEGQVVTIVAQSKRGTVSKDTFSLMGFTVADKEAARRCGFKTSEPKKVTPEIIETSCNQKISSCTVSELCSKASTVRSGKKVWRSNSSAQKFVNGAKNLGLACGVKVQSAGPKVSPTPTPKFGETYKVASGTGFYVSDDGHIITNYHVIDGCEDMKVHSKGRIIPTLQIAYDKSNDLALLKISESPSYVFALSQNSPIPLQKIIVAGFPFGERYSTALKFTEGIVSALTGMGNNYSEIQIDAALQQGNSGGPIIDEYGNIVAVAVAKLDAKYMLEKYGIIPENTNFGVKVSAVKNLLEGNNVSLKVPNKSSVSIRDLGNNATNGTVYLTCWMTTAQIETMRSKKVLFEDLD